MTEEINFQTWICPTCFDDHPMIGPCVPSTKTGLFMPHPQDHSKIADEYRDRVAEIQLLKRKLQIAVDALNSIIPEHYTGKYIRQLDRESFIENAEKDIAIKEAALKEIEAMK